MQAYFKTDLTGLDLRDVDLSGVKCAYSNLTNCQFGKCIGTNFVCTTGPGNFTEADITDANFEKASVITLQSLKGATWRGQKITHVSDWITNEEIYWCFATNAFVEIGCMSRPLEEWIALGQSEETLSALLQEQPKINIPVTFKWWQEHSPAIIAICQSFKSE